jgi:hypothetical protein
MSSSVVRQLETEIRIAVPLGSAHPARPLALDAPHEFVGDVRAVEGEADEHPVPSGIPSRSKSHSHATSSTTDADGPTG